MMRKRRSRPSPFPSNPSRQAGILDWRNVPQQEFYVYARAFHAAAQKMAATLELDSAPLNRFAACPVVFMYRHATELHLKGIVLGEGTNFLATKPDPLSVYKTRSLSWLGQFVCQIVTALKWEADFKCEGIENLADLKAIIEDINSLDPVPHTCRYGSNDDGQDSSTTGQIFDVQQFARKMDALLALLDSTADALAATWDMRRDVSVFEGVLDGDSGGGPMIQ
jgi:hypothetical protein